MAERDLSPEEERLIQENVERDATEDEIAQVEAAAANPPESPFADATAAASGTVTRADPRRRPGPGESFVQGAANTFGTGDTLGALFQAALQEGADLPDWLRGDMTLGELQQRRNDTFSDARAENLRLSRAGMEDNPASSIAGRMLPGLMTGPATGFGVTGAASLGSGAATGAIEGGARSEAESVPGFLWDVGKGALYGGLGGGAGYAGGKYLLAPAGAYVGRQAGRMLARNADSLQEGAEQFARERALKAAGYIQKDLPDTRQGMNALLRRGQRYLDEPGFIRYGSSAAAINDRAEALRKAAGAKIGEYLAQADEAAGDMAFNPYQLASRARAEGGIVDEALNNPNLRQQGGAMDEWLADTLDTERRLAARGEPFSFQRANEYKGGLQRGVYNNKGLVKPNEEVADDFQRLLIQEIDDQAEPFIGEAGVVGFRNARQRYGDFDNAAKRSAQQMNREVGNNFMGLKDMQAGQMAQQANDLPYVGPAIAFASKLARGRMDSTAARAADAFAKSGTLQTLMNTSPEVVGAYGGAVGGAAGQAMGDWLTDVARTNPEVLGRWGEYLGSAAAQSSEALGSAHRDLQETDPEYQAAMRRNGGQQP